jgi:hypothetical protein
MQIFSKRKYIKESGQEEYEKDKNWVDKLDGIEITQTFKNGDGMIGNFFIAHEWMEEK